MTTALIVIIILNMILIMRIEDLHTKIRDLNNDVDHLRYKLSTGQTNPDDGIIKIGKVIDEVN